MLSVMIINKILRSNLGIISRASAARGGTSIYDDDLEHDSISNSETNRNAWTLPEDTRAMHTPNKLSWSNGGMNPLRKVREKFDPILS